MSLSGRVCLVTGASRGIGKGCARALADLGASVYITGRNRDSLEASAADIGGKCVGIVCDHAHDDEVEQLFERIKTENEGRLDLLVNNCYAAVPMLLGKDKSADVGKFWMLDPLIWDTVNNVGLRANYIASVYAARLMTARGTGLIVNMSSMGGVGYIFNAAYGVGKCAMDRMAADMNHELRGTGVNAISLWPGAVKTELVQENILDAKATTSEMVEAQKMFASGQTTDWVGRTVAQLMLIDIQPMAGRVVWCQEIGDKYDIRDNDGSVVPSIRSLRMCFKFAGMANIAQWIPAFIKVPSCLFNFLLLRIGNKF